MAIKLNYTDAATGITLVDAHVKVGKITGGSKNNVYFYVKIWKDKASKQAGKEPVTTLHYEYAPEGGMAALFTELYDYLKTLPEFTGALDEED